MPKRINYKEGEQIGSLIYLRDSGIKNNRRIGVFKCFCGKEFNTSISAVKYKHTKSCGCYHPEPANKTHGMSETSEFSIWSDMKKRCYNQKSTYYEHYGGRGIKVCEKWNKSFVDFFTDMGPRPSKKHSLDRIDCNGDYTQENCRWTTQMEQCNNTRRNFYITYLGETKTASQWSRIVKIRSHTLIKRINDGWSIKDALTRTPSWMSINYSKRLEEYNIKHTFGWV